MSAAVLDRDRGVSRRLERCPACSEPLQNLGDVSVCINCSCGYSEPPVIPAPVKSTDPPRVITPPPKNVVSLKGCLQCGSTFFGDACFCGAVYNEPTPETYIATAAPPTPRHVGEAAMCGDCWIPRDLVDGQLVCPGCHDAKSLADDAADAAVDQTQGETKTETITATPEPTATIAPPMIAETIAQVPAASVSVPTTSVPVDELANRRGGRRKGR